MAYSFISGKDGKANFGGTDVCVTGWGYSETATSADTTHSCSSGVKTEIVVNTEYTGTLEGNVDEDAWPTASPNLRVGQSGTLKLYLTSTEYIELAVLIHGFSIESTVDDLISFSVDWKGTAAPTTIMS